MCILPGHFISPKYDLMVHLRLLWRQTYLLFRIY